MNIKKKYKIILIVIPIILVLTLFLKLYEPPFNYNQLIKNNKITIEAYSDIDINGNSTSKVLKNKDDLAYTYSIGDKKEYPYAGIMIYNKDKSFINLSKYNHCKIKIRAEHGKSIPFYINSNIPNTSNWKEPNSFFNLQYILKINKEWQEIDVDFKDFNIPPWWLQFINKTEDELDYPDFSEVSIINFANCILLNRNKKDTIEIDSIVFYKSLIPFYVYSIIFLIIYFSALYFFVFKKKKTEQALFSYTKTETVSHKDKDLEKIFVYINSNYEDPNLSIIDVQNDTGISERKISTLIKTETNLNFKQFINNLRIVEAKRLILETDLQISEIAFKIGYGNISHFNRVFKTIENISPSEFRKGQKG